VQGCENQTLHQGDGMVETTEVFEYQTVPSLGIRLSRPVVVPLIGLPGAGKSVVARHLVDALQVRRVCRDDIRAALFPDCAYTLPEKRAAFRAVLLAVEVNSALAESVVIDGMTFSRRKDLERVAEIAAKYSALMVPIWLDVPSHVAKERVAADIHHGKHSAKDRDPGMVDAVLERFETPSPSIAAIDATLAPAEVCRLAREIVLARANPGSVNAFAG
jgi:predicted kinase